MSNILKCCLRIFEEASLLGAVVAAKGIANSAMMLPLEQGKYKAAQNTGDAAVAVSSLWTAEIVQTKMQK